MEIKYYETPGAFLEDNRDFLREREAACQLNIGNAAAHREEPRGPGLLFGRCEEAGRPVLLFGNTLPWNLCLNAISGDPAALSAAVLLAEALRAKGIPLRGVTGQERVCRAFFAAAGRQPVLRTAMDILVLERVTEPAAVPGTPRPAGEADLPLVLDWARAFHLEAMGEVMDEAALARTEGRTRAGNVYLWIDRAGAPAAMAAIGRELPHGAAVNMVYTSPAQRGKGFCQNLVGALCADRLSQGDQYLTLFVDRANPISNRAYEKIGFRFLEDCADYQWEG